VRVCPALVVRAAVQQPASQRFRLRSGQGGVVGQEAGLQPGGECNHHDPKPQGLRYVTPVSPPARESVPMSSNPLRRLVEAIPAALEEQIVVVPGTAAEASCPPRPTRCMTGDAVTSSTTRSKGILNAPHAGAGRAIDTSRPTITSLF
jgi:hypothetical protein